MLMTFLGMKLKGYSKSKKKRASLSYATIPFMYYRTSACHNSHCMGKFRACTHRNYELAYFFSPNRFDLGKVDCTNDSSYRIGQDAVTWQMIALPPGLGDSKWEILLFEIHFFSRREMIVFHTCWQPNTFIHKYLYACAKFWFVSTIVLWKLRPSGLQEIWCVCQLWYCKGSLKIQGKCVTLNSVLLLFVGSNQGSLAKMPQIENQFRNLLKQ